MSGLWGDQMRQRDRDRKRKEKDRRRRERRKLGTARRVGRALRNWW